MNPSLVNILRIAFGIFCIVFGMDKFLEFLPTCSLIPNLPPFSMEAVGVLEIGIGILLLLNKYTRPTLLIVTAIMSSGVLLHILLGTSDFSGALVGTIWGILLIYFTSSTS